MPAPLTLASHVALDHALFVVIALVTPLVDWLWLYPRLKRALAAGVPGARSRFYLEGGLWSWGLTLCVLTLWASRGRPWAGLGLGLGTPLRLGIGLALAILYLVLMGRQRRALLARPDRLARLYRGMGAAQPLLPHTPGERKGFALVAITAGVCEEVLFRGFVMWYVGVWTGPVLAVVISSLLFGFAHQYLGVTHVLRTAIVGVIFALIVLAAGSLWPVILIHAAMDLVAGDLGYRALSGAPADDPGPGLPAAAQ